MRDIKGILAALITPFNKDGSINYPVLNEVIDYELSQGIDGFYVGGSTSECFLLSVEERKKLVEAVVKYNNGRGIVLAHVGSIGTDLTVELGKHAKAAGVDAISAVTPFYYKFTPEQIVQYYYDIADRTDMRVIAYNFPTLTGYALTVNDIDKLSKNANVAGVKYTCLDLYTMERFKHLHPELVIYNGHDEVMLYGLTAGADGGIGSTYNFMPDKFRKLVDCFKSGKIAEAQQIQHEINTIIPYVGKYGSMQAAKEFLTLRGMPCGDSRGPFTPLDENAKKELKQVFDTYLK